MTRWRPPESLPPSVRVHAFSAVWASLRHAMMAVPGLRIIAPAIRNYVLHQSAIQAGSLAFSL